MTPTLPDELSLFLAGSETTERNLLALAAAESLTDALAHDLLRVAFGNDARPERFVDTLHLCDFVVERNSEWHFAPRVREVLVQQLTSGRDLSERVHGRLLELAEPGNAPVHLPNELPRYLQADVGRAYHATFLSAEGVHRYARLADQPLSGQQWLAGQLASEQVRLGVIPEDAIEVMFLHGMILYRERRWDEAERLLREVAKRSELRHEVAVATHLVGRIDGRDPPRRKRAEAFLLKSLEIGRALENRFHVAQVLHTLGQLVGRDPDRRAEAEELLQESLESRRTLGDPFDIAQVLQTLGQLVGRDPSRRAEAEELLQESLEIERTLGNPRGTVQLLHTLGQLVGRDPDRRAEAEELLQESLESRRTLGDPFDIAHVLHTLGQLVGRDPDRRAEAEELLHESLEIGRDLNHPNHQAQVLKTLGQLVGRDPSRRVEAEELLQESLKLNRQMHNPGGVRIVERALQILRKGWPPDGSRNT
jgi:tetratricopeptide (TPR) repeat protein